MSPAPGPDPTRSVVAGRLQDLGYGLPAPPAPVGHYAAARLDGDRVVLSGHTDRGAGGRSHGGPLRRTDEELTAARRCAEHAAVHLLASAGAVCDLDQLALLHLRGYVVATADFVAHPQVIDAASVLLHQVLGGGPHTRAAIGVASLPGGAVVELEATFQRRPARPS